MSFYGAVLGAIVRIECPKCREVQVRARKPPHVVVRCRRCGTPLVAASR